MNLRSLLLLVCADPLGMEYHQITAAQISASSQFDANHPPTHGRLHFKGGYGSWAASANDLHQWFQINLRVEANVTFVATQGRHGDPNQRLTEYKLQYSKDGISFQVFRQHGENSDKVRRFIQMTKQIKKNRKAINQPLSDLGFGLWFSKTIPGYFK